jgi:3-oxoacyl-[acyl-carrier protein] reductase
MTTDSSPLAGKVALVTGASRRIGRATALELARHGADVVVHARESRDEVEAVAKEIRTLGRRALVQLCDVASEPQVTAMMRAIVAEFGRLDVLVNNAAIRRHAPFTEMSLADWHEIMSVILDGAFLCIRSAIPLMQKNGGGAIVNIGGISAHIGAMHRAHVSAAKAGLIGLTKALAVEFAESNIRVNCVAPGKIGGERSKTAGASITAGSAKPLLPREGTAEEVAAMISMLCLPSSGYVTGQTIHVDGGMYLP